MGKTLKKISFLINKQNKKKLVILLLLLLFGMFLEIIGLGIIIPMVSILLDPQLLEKTEEISYLIDFLPVMSEQILIYFFLGLVIGVYLFKSLFLGILSLKKNRFLQSLTASISNNLYSGYLNQEYKFHLNKNASELINNIQVEMNLLNTLISSIITIIIEVGFVISIIFTLMYIEFISAISVGTFFAILTLIFFQFTKRKIDGWGEIRHSIDSKISKMILEGFGGIKDLLILGKTNFYASNFSEENLIKHRIIANQETLTQISRFYLEFMAVAGLISFIAIMHITGKATTDLIGILGVFVAASFRLLPSLNRIVNSTQTIKYTRPSADLIYKEISSMSEIKISIQKQINFKFKSSIELTNVEFNFNNDVEVLKHINLKIEKGQTIGIIGFSGSGKSTLIDLIMGLHKPTGGEIKIDGVLNFQLDQSWRNIIGYVSQSIYLIDDSIKNNIALGVPNKDISDVKIIELLRQVQLEEFVNKLKLGIYTKVGERGVQLSGGQIQRIGIARALYNSPDILILDEATSALDSKTENEVMECVYSLKGDKTIIMIAHRLHTLKKCDFLYEVNAN